MKLIFQHIPKCGGTTLHEFLASHFKPEEVCPHRFNDLGWKPQEERERYRFYSGHYDTETCRKIPGPKVTITLLRDPVSRTISNYQFWRRHPDGGPHYVELAKTLGLPAFIGCRDLTVRDNVENTMVRQLSSRHAGAHDPFLADPEMSYVLARDALTTMTLVGFVERYDEFMARLCGLLGIDFPDRIEPRNVTEERLEVDEATKTQLRHLNEWDQRLYDWALGR